MDSKPDFLSQYKRPIVLSPPPVEPAAAYPGMADHPGYHSQRNQSVGYNLQQEFEALKADLDLDLSHSARDDDGSSSSSNRTLSAPRMLSGGPSLLSPASNPAYQGEPLLRDKAISPSLSHSGTASGLQLLLINKSLGLLPSLLAPARPQSVNDFSNFRQVNLFLRMQQPSSFYADMLQFTAWIENLSPQEIISMLDYWCNNMPFDILLTMKSKLEAHLHLGMQPAVFHKGTYPQYQGDFVDMESLSLDERLQSTGLAQPKPKANSAFRSHLFVDPKVQRPKLADPSLHNRFPQNPIERSRSPTSHLFEKTSFLQLAAGSAASSPYAHNDDGLDVSAASKLGALATINLRVALDSSRKNFPAPRTAAAYEESINRQANSSSVPATTQKYSVAALGGAKKKEADSPLRAKSALLPSSAAGLSSMPSEIASPELLGNIPAWLKLLRLHKYTDCLKDVHWLELVELGDQELEDKGVKALGARRKLLKAFEAVKLANA